MCVFSFRNTKMKQCKFIDGGHFVRRRIFAKILRKPERKQMKKKRIATHNLQIDESVSWYFMAISSQFSELF